MTTNNFNQIKWEPIHTTNDWEVHFNMEWYRKLQERQKYDKIWELIKKKNNW